MVLVADKVHRLAGRRRCVFKTLVRPASQPADSSCTEEIAMDRRMADYRLASFRRHHRRLAGRWLETEDDHYGPGIDRGSLKRCLLVISSRLPILAALFKTGKSARWRQALATNSTDSEIGAERPRGPGALSGRDTHRGFRR
jgi:hypothetical protein